MTYTVQVPNLVRAIRLNEGLTLRQLADRMGVHYTTVSKIEKSQRKLTPEWLARFAAAFGVEPHQICPSDATVERANREGRRIPVIGMVAAGVWREAIGLTDDTIPVPIDEPNAFGLKVTGDSMDKIVPDGGVVLVDPDQAELHDGRLYVVINEEGETTFKKYRASPARLEPLSNNPAHATIILGRSSFSIVGMVVGAYQAL